MLAFLLADSSLFHDLEVSRPVLYRCVIVGTQVKTKAQTNVTNDLNNFSRQYSNDEENGTLSSNCAFYLNHQPDHLQSSPQAFHYNDEDMSYLLIVVITAEDSCQSYI